MSNQQRFTVFTGDGDFLSNQSRHGLMELGLQELIDYGMKSYGVPYVAWAADSPAPYNGVKTRKDLFQESLSAGRTIELVDGKYIPRGVQAEPKQLFRVGGHYRAACGAVVELFGRGKSWGGGEYEVFNGLNLDGRVGSNNGQWLLDGRYCNGVGGLDDMLLLPGELREVDGQWIAADEEKTIPGKKLLETLKAAEARPAADEDPEVAEILDALIEQAWQQAGPKRARLTWADTKPSDRWDGYTVKKFTQEQTKHQGLPAADLQEVSPLCGSAWLVLGE